MICQLFDNFSLFRVIQDLTPNRVPVMKSSLLTIFLLLLLSRAMAEPSEVKGNYDEWMQHCPKQRVLMESPKVETGRCVLFSGDMNAVLCNELRVAGRVVGWVSGVQVIEKKAVAHMCLMDYEFDGSFFADVDSQPGMVSDGLYEISAPVSSGGHKHVVLKPLALPGYSAYSNPNYCGSRIAYWASREKGESSQWEALVVELNDQAVLASKRMGFKYLESDDHGVLPPPAWTKNCEAATFQYPEYMHKPGETLYLPK